MDYALFALFVTVCIGIYFLLSKKPDKPVESISHEHTWSKWRSSVTFQTRNCTECGWSESVPIVFSN